MQSVGIVGGGWAGLAAAVCATEAGNAVTLFEMAPQLGGRARHIDHASRQGPADWMLDNGQHLLIGAYRETLRLMNLVGVDPAEALRRTPLCLIDPQGHGLKFPANAASPLRAFLHATHGHRGWTWREKLALMRAALGWRWRQFKCAPCLTVSQLCAGLPPAVQRDLINPLCVAALNTPAERASGQVFLRVMHDALMTEAGGSDLLIPARPLGMLWPQPAAQWLQARGAVVKTHHRVQSLQSRGMQWLLDDAPFDQVIIAATASEASRLCMDIHPGWARQASQLEYEPIVTVYAHSPGAQLPQPMLRLADDAQNPAQFVIDTAHATAHSGRLALVVSAAQHGLAQGQDTLTAAVLRQANTALRPYLRQPLTSVLTVTEKRATFLCTPQLARPARAIARGLHAAGDYVEGPYPATLEGALRSGVAASEALSR